MSRPPNPARGEAGIQISGRTHVLRPSFENLIAAEEEVGSLFALVERASEGSLTIREMNALLWHCLPVEERPSRDEVGYAVIEMGLVAAAVPVRTILAEVLHGRA